MTFLSVMGLARSSLRKLVGWFGNADAMEFHRSMAKRYPEKPKLRRIPNTRMTQAIAFHRRG